MQKPYTDSIEYISNQHIGSLLRQLSKTGTQFERTGRLSLLVSIGIKDWKGSIVEYQITAEKVSKNLQKILESVRVKRIRLQVLEWSQSFNQKKTNASSLATLSIDNHDESQKLISLSAHMHTNFWSNTGFKAVLDSFSLSLTGGQGLHRVTFTSIEHQMEILKKVIESKSKKLGFTFSPTVSSNGVTVTAGLDKLLAAEFQKDESFEFMINCAFFSQALQAQVGQNTHWEANRRFFMDSGNKNICEYPKYVTNALNTPAISQSWDINFFVDLGTWKYTNLADEFTFSGSTKYFQKVPHTFAGMFSTTAANPQKVSVQKILDIN